MKDEDIQKFMDDNADLFKSLAQDLWCPSCQKAVPPPFFNLGEKFHSAEGCKSCYDSLQGN